MKRSFYLIFNKKGVVGIRKKSPTLLRGEGTVKINIEVPDAYFKRTIQEVTLVIPEEAISPNKIELVLSSDNWLKAITEEKEKIQ